MEKAVGHTQADFAGVRTGRATSGLVEHLKVDVYGAEAELRTIAGLSVPEQRALLVISPYDKSTPARDIEKANPGLGSRHHPLQRRQRHPASASRR